MDANKNLSSVALNETPSPIPSGPGPTQIVDPQWGKYNDPAKLLNFVETHIVEL